MRPAVFVSRDRGVKTGEVTDELPPVWRIVCPDPSWRPEMILNTDYPATDWVPTIEYRYERTWFRCRERTFVVYVEVLDRDMDVIATLAMEYLHQHGAERNAPRRTDAEERIAEKAGQAAAPTSGRDGAAVDPQD